VLGKAHSTLKAPETGLFLCLREAQSNSPAKRIEQMKYKQNTLVPRNPFAIAAKRRKAGAHELPQKTKRRDEKQQLKKMLREIAP
jgi:hypothetical protein